VTKIMNSEEIENFMQDVRSDLGNLDELINYYNFLENHNIRTIVFNPENDRSFFEGAVVAILEQRYREFFRSKFNVEMDEIVRLDMLEIIRSNIPNIEKRLD
ncbi:MAG: hypothetical protein MK224_03305, partial [Candidatus Nitrosopelagicus sp.]|nr:hypothetical protein [Candidatus Nitrosopelagicus sp.]